jgi:FO synthase
VPLPFVHMEAPLYLKGQARKGPSLREAILMHAVARLTLHPHFRNIQVSWVKLGPRWAQACLASGANDMGGTLMNESITRAAGAAFGQELPPEAMQALIESAGRIPYQRTTLYREAPFERVTTSFHAAPLEATVNPPPRRHQRSRIAQDLVQ